MLYKYVLLTKRAVKMAGYWLNDLLCIISLSGKFFSLPHISNIIKKHYNLLLSSNRCKKVFQHLPVVAFRRTPTFVTYLSQLNSPLILPTPNFLLVPSVVAKTAPPNVT